MSNNILVNEQIGFHDHVSTDSAIFKFIESIFDTWYNKEYITGLFYYLKLEFYGVKRSILLVKILFA